MRCGCPECGVYMDHLETMELGCICPNCGYKCSACLGTKSVISRAELAQMREKELLRIEHEEK